jgi:L-methionine (R)-S-oxide reductase
MDDDERQMAQVLEQIRIVLEGEGDRAGKAERIAEAIRRVGDYRWVGLYEVSGGQIGVLGWSGPAEPSYPHFPATEGLCSAAVSSHSTVVVGDVRSDPRYLTTFGSTWSEIVVPIIDGAGRGVLGVVDVESERPHAFGEADSAFLERCAALVLPLWEGRE